LTALATTRFAQVPSETAAPTTRSDPETASQATASRTSSDPQPSPNSSNSKGVSGALIAGAVVGPICAVALILGLAFLFLRQRRNNTLTAITPTLPEAQTQPPQSGYTTAFGSYGDGKEAPLVNVGPASPSMSVPSAYNSYGAPGGAAALAGAHHSEINAQPPFQAAQSVGKTLPHGGHGVVQLGINPQVNNMPMELPIGSREHHRSN
jgi:predicted lipid-binding transport protein (Tim44 family)